MDARLKAIPKPALALYILAAAILVLGAGPLLLYIAFGPENGNPVGLGMLFLGAFMLAMPVLLCAVGVHVLKVWLGGKPNSEDLVKRSRFTDPPGSRSTGAADPNWP